MDRSGGGRRARVRALVSGRVHGVAFRYFVREWASDLGVTGWVRNLADGRVEVLAEGDEEKVDALLGRLSEGPRLARVEKLDVRREEFRGEFADFRIVF